MLRHQALIQVEAKPRRHDWLTAAGLANLASRGWLTFSSSIHALVSALAGFGGAIAHTPFVVAALAAGQLEAPFARSRRRWLPSGVRPRAEIRKIRVFRHWLLQQAS
jgi:hypothetical protein